jgi:hypothetical protein
MRSDQRAGKRDGRTASKPVRSSMTQLPVTESVIETHNKPASPRQRYALLKPWLDLANNETVGLFQLAHSAFDLTESFREPLRRSVKAWLEALCRSELRSYWKSWFEKLEELGQRSHVAGRTIHLPAWEAEGGEFWGEFQIDSSGRLRENPFNPRDEFKRALQGAEIDRLRQCEICGHFFYAVPIDRKTCSQKCNTTRRVRAWRAHQAKYEQTRKEKPETAKSKTRRAKPRKEHRK